MRTLLTTYFFRSKSTPGATYQTLRFSDGTLSCDCKGWTRRVQPNGTRTCCHTRSVLAGAMHEAFKIVDEAPCSYVQMNDREDARILAGAAIRKRAPEPEPVTVNRHIELE